MNTADRFGLGDPEGWDLGATEIADPAGAARVLSRALTRLEPRLEWDGSRLRSHYWRRRPKARKGKQWIRPRLTSKEAEAEAVEADNRGMSVSDLVEEVAENMGLSRPRLHQLLIGSARRVSWRTIKRIGEHLTESELREWLAHILTRQVLRGRQEYAAYVDSELRRLGRGRPRGSTVWTLGAEGEIRRRFLNTIRRLGAPFRRAALADLRVYDAIIGWSGLRDAITDQERIDLVKRGYLRELRVVRLELRALTVHTRGSARRAPSGKTKNQSRHRQRSIARASWTPQPGEPDFRPL